MDFISESPYVSEIGAQAAGLVAEVESLGCCGILCGWIYGGEAFCGLRLSLLTAL